MDKIKKIRFSVPAVLMLGVVIGYVASNVDTWTKPVNAAPPGEKAAGVSFLPEEARPL